jgi:hypothetical protein
MLAEDPDDASLAEFTMGGLVTECFRVHQYIIIREWRITWEMIVVKRSRVCHSKFNDWLREMCTVRSNYGLDSMLQLVMTE